jgi:DNA modification methylase
MASSLHHSEAHEKLLPAYEIVRPGRSLQEIEKAVPEEALSLVASLGQQALPAIAKHPTLPSQIELLVRGLSSWHRIFLGDSRKLLQCLPEASVHLVLTSPPYWTLKPYPPRQGQLAELEDYDSFLAALNEIWRQVFRILVPGGRLIIVVGDVCISRRSRGRHTVFPLHASIQESCRKLGFENLAPIIWYKITNAQLEAPGKAGSFLGKPYEPNSVIKNDVEFILFQRKPGGYRQQPLAIRILSVIPKACHEAWFRQVWTLPGTSTRHHPAPFPLTLAERLIRMFSFVGDTVLDPFMGSGTTNLAAARLGRNSIGVEIEPTYVTLALRAFEEVQQQNLAF